MNEKCKYCDYVSKCSRKCEYGSILCLTQRSFSKIVDKSYEELQQENKILKENAENNDKAVDKVNWENQLLKKENKQLKEQLLVTQTNEETFRLEMEDITKTLELDENALFDDVKAYARNLKDNWIKLKEIMKEETREYWNTNILEIMQKIEQGSDNK